MTEIACAFIAALSAVITAAVTTKNGSARKKQERRAEQRSRESRLMLDMIYAGMQLSIGTARAIKNGKSNGEMAAGLEAVNKCSERYSQFIEEIAFDHLIK